MYRKWDEASAKNLISRRETSSDTFEAFCQQEEMSTARYYQIIRKYLPKHTKISKKKYSQVIQFVGEEKNKSIELCFPSGYKLRFDHSLSQNQLENYIEVLSKIS